MWDRGVLGGERDRIGGRRGGREECKGRRKKKDREEVGGEGGRAVVRQGGK